MNIYVGNLPYSATDDTVRELFEEFGAVSSATIIKDQYSGKSKGFGFVEMEEKADAESAIEKLDGMSIDGRSITVNEARPRAERPRSGAGGGGGNKRW